MVLSIADARSQIVAQIVDGADSSITPSKLRQCLVDLLDALDAAIKNDGSLYWGFAFDAATVDADPGAGKLRINNGVFGSASSIYISETSSDGSIAALMDVWDDSSSTIKAIIEIRDPMSTENWAVAHITGGITDAGAYRKIPISPIASAGSFTGGAKVRVAVTRTGDAGTGAVTSVFGRSGAVAAANDDYAVTQLAAISANSLVGNNTGATARPIVLTVAQIKTLLAIAMADITDASANGRSLVAAANYAAMKTLLGISTGDVSGLGSIATFAEASAAQIQANAAGKAVSTDKLWSAVDPITLTDAATITPDFAAGINFKVTLGGSRTLANPSNATKVGQSGFIRILQDGTGGRALSFGANWKFDSGVDPTLSTSANAVNVLFYSVTAANEVTASLLVGVS